MTLGNTTCLLRTRCDGLARSELALRKIVVLHNIY